MITPEILNSVRDYCLKIESGNLEGYTEYGRDSDTMRTCHAFAHELESGSDVDMGVTTVTVDDVLVEMQEGDLWLRSGDANITTSLVNLLLLHGYPDEATRLNNALFRECAVAVVWREVE